jgi:hypothetical protein
MCDGFEAMDRRIGVLGSADEAGRKALFLRTYSRHVMLFEKEKNSEAMRRTLSHGRTQSTIQRRRRAAHAEPRPELGCLCETRLWSARANVIGRSGDVSRKAMHAPSHPLAPV